jgi:hypothetical protein
MDALYTKGPRGIRTRQVDTRQAWIKLQPSLEPCHPSVCYDGRIMWSSICRIGRVGQALGWKTAR